MGQVRSLPVGLSFVGPDWSKARGAPTHLPSLEDAPEVRAAMAPASP